jgi:hypothetical protein
MDDGSLDDGHAHRPACGHCAVAALAMFLVRALLSVRARGVQGTIV